MRLSREKINHISKLIIDSFGKWDSLEFLKDPNDVRLHIVRIITDELRVDEEVDLEVRRTLSSYSKKLMEGSREWDVLYQKHYGQELSKRRL